MNSIVLHSILWDRLCAMDDRLPHALLLAGPPGVLKAEFAYALAGAMLCETPGGLSEACKTCAPCNWFLQGNHPDFRWLKPASMDDRIEEEGGKKAAGKEKPSREITIDQVRELGEFLNLGTHRAGRRVVLITPAESMNRNTANALLKSLEEPRPGTLFILVSDAAERLLPTIRSRCMNFSMGQPARLDALQWLHQNGIKGAESWLDRAGGAPRLAREIAQGSQGKLLQILEKSFCRGSEMDSMALAAETDQLLRTDSSLSAYAAVDWTQRWLVDAVLVQHGQRPNYFCDHEAHIRRISESINKKQLFKFNTETDNFKKLSQHTLNSRLFFEDFFSRYMKLFAPGVA